MRIAGINKFDIAAAPGISVSIFMQGCPHKCKGCHNPETWSFDGGYEVSLIDLLNELDEVFETRPHVQNLCIMGGEPLCEENIPYVLAIVQHMRLKFPEVKINIWTGYLLEILLAKENDGLNEILNETDLLIDGPYVEELRDLRLLMRGSSNQRLIKTRGFLHKPKNERFERLQ